MGDLGARGRQAGALQRLADELQDAVLLRGELFHVGLRRVGFCTRFGYLCLYTVNGWMASGVRELQSQRWAGLCPLLLVVYHKYGNMVK